MDMKGEARAWKNLWSAGQGVGGIADVPPVAELCARLRREYDAAMRAAAADPFLVREAAE
jgi:nitronate monooxygenase